MVLICLFSFNRYGHFKLCLEFLLKSIKSNEIRIVIFDDGSTEQKMVEYLEFLKNKIEVHFSSKKKESTTVREGASRIGNQRKKAIDYYLSQSDEKYVILLDDDVVITEESIFDLIRDFEFLDSTDYAKPGAMTFHGLSNPDCSMKIDGKVFSRFHFTGEAHIVFSRKTLLKVGNHFGGGSKEFADIQISQVLNAGLYYYERTWPYYQIQHIGFGTKGSIIHEHQKKPPPWAVGPYMSRWKRYNGPILVPEFNIQEYCAFVSEHGGDKAPLIYFEAQNGSKRT